MSLQDPLLRTLVVLGRLHGKPVNLESISAGLPLDGPNLTPELFIRAAKRAQFEVQVSTVDLDQIPAAEFPVVVISNHNEPLIVTEIEGDEAKTISPIFGSASQTIKVSDLKKQHSSYVFFARPAYQRESRSNLAGTHNVAHHWFWGELWSYRRFYSNAIGASIFINMFALTSSLFIMNVYDRVVPNQAMDTLHVLAVGAISIFIFDFCLRTLRTFFLDRAGDRADKQMAAALYEKLMAMKVSSRPASSGAIASQAKAYEGLREFFTSATIASLVDLPFVVFFIVVIFLLGGWTALPVLLGTLFVLILGFLFQYPISRAVADGYAASTQRHALVVETVGSIETIKGARAESVYQKKMESAIDKSTESNSRARWWSSWVLNLTTFTHQVVSVLVVVVAVYQIIAGNLTMGGMIASVMLSGRAMAPLFTVASLLTRFQQFRTALRSLDSIMELPSERRTGALDSPAFGTCRTIQMADVSFTYPGGGREVLRGLDFTVNEGERVGLLGPIGSGKSTLLRLLMAYYSPTEGTIYIGGANAEQLDPAWLRKSIGYVSQDTQLLYGSLRDNILLGCPWRSDDDVIQATRIAGIGDFLLSHEEGLNKQAGERGELLSGGQRQAVCLARAMVGQPDLLLLDEPTSAMDTKMQSVVIGNLKQYFSARPKRTLIVSTHKPAMLELVDRVIVLDKGGVFADGPKEQILRSLKGSQKQNEQSDHLRAA